MILYYILYFIIPLFAGIHCVPAIINGTTMHFFLHQYFSAFLIISLEEIPGMELLDQTLEVFLKALDNTSSSFFLQ